MVREDNLHVMVCNIPRYRSPHKPVIPHLQKCTGQINNVTVPGSSFNPYITAVTKLKLIPNKTWRSLWPEGQPRRSEDTEHKCISHSSRWLSWYTHDNWRTTPVFCRYIGYPCMKPLCFIGVHMYVLFSELPPNSLNCLFSVRSSLYSSRHI